ncbi:MAG TPA: CsgG/HfaB family protein [Thermoanaerobaculia bacterium]|nr:CsgG/HfaB family protein [Thermoanaerobaculia bacterium]
MKPRLIHLALTIAVCLITVTAFAADRPVVAVNEFRNETSAGWWYGGVEDDLADMLASELASTDEFKVVERKKLGAVLDEQDLAAAGRIKAGTGAKIGELTGAQYLIMSTVTAYEEKTQGGGGGIAYRGISLGGKKDDAYIAIDLRVVDTTTGEVAFARTVEARSGGFGVNVGVWRGGVSTAFEKHKNTPAGKAIRAVTLEMVDYLACAMVYQDDCMAEFKSKDRSRRDKTKRAVKLD